MALSWKSHLVWIVELLTDVIPLQYDTVFDLQRRILVRLGNLEVDLLSVLLGRVRVDPLVFYQKALGKCSTSLSLKVVCSSCGSHSVLIHSCISLRCEIFGVSHRLISLVLNPLLVLLFQLFKTVLNGNFLGWIWGDCTLKSLFQLLCNFVFCLDFASQLLGHVEYQIFESL